MSTTVHIPASLLARVDARARSRGLSRNKLIVEALERSLDTASAWPPELVEMLATPLDAESAGLLEASLAEVRRRRTSRRRGSPVR